MVDEKINQKIEELSVETNIKNLKREKGNYEINIEFHNELLKRLDVEETTLKKRYEIMLKKGNFKLLEPRWEYEKDPEYIKTLIVDVENKQRNDMAMINQNREQIKKTILHQEQALESVTKELKRLEGDKND